MLVKRILKTDEKRQAYYQFILPYERYSLRWLCGLGMVFSVVFLFIDKERGINLNLIGPFRIFAGVMFGASLALSFTKLLNVQTFHWAAYLLSSFSYLQVFFSDYYASMPVFFLPNALYLYLFAYNSALGFPLRFKIGQVMVLLLVYVSYSKYFSPHSLEHSAQIWNIILNGLLAVIIGWLLERYKVLNFRHHIQLIESRKRNEELNSLKSRLISIMSHDLASPVNNLKTLLSLQESNAITKEELSNYSKKVKGSLENLSGMMSGLLKWSNSQLNGFQLRSTDVRIKLLVEEVLKTLEMDIIQKKLLVLNEVNDTDSLILDGEILKIVIRNFLTNAIKFSKVGGTISIRCISENQTVGVSVIDEGVGITHQELDELFTFKKRSSEGTLQEKGAGVGLMITKDFVEMMGGKIIAKSEKGKGSEFSVVFPVK